MGKFDDYEFKKIEFNTWQPEKEGEQLTGVLVGKESEVGVNDSNTYSLQVDDEVITVWGSTVIDPRLKHVEVGAVVRLTYLGKKLSKKTGRSYHDFNVEVGKKPEPGKVVEEKVGE